MKTLARIVIDPQVMNGQLAAVARRVSRTGLDDVRQALEFAARNVPDEISLTHPA